MKTSDLPTELKLSSPTISASELHKVQNNVALAFVDQVLGNAEVWKSTLIKYRLTSDFQRDWKA